MTHLNTLTRRLDRAQRTVGSQQRLETHVERTQKQTRRAERSAERREPGDKKHSLKARKPT
jgi:hypothetical protein